MIVDGFRREIRSGVSGLMGDVQLTASALTYYGEGEAIAVHDSLLLAIDAVRGVKSVVPVIYRSAVLRTENGLQGVLVKATPEYSDSALTVAIPTSLSRKLGVAEGDYLPSYFIGDKVKVRRFKVGRVYPDYLRTDDQQIVLCGLSDLQRVNGWDSTAVSALEVGLAERFSKPDAQRAKAEELSLVTGLASSASVDRYRLLFDWLHLLDFNVLAILLLMTLVAGFNMVSGLLIMLFRNTSAIGTLKALGMGNRGVAKVFLKVASGVVLKGMVIGWVGAILFALVQEGTHLIKLNPENYFVSWVPADIHLLKILAICALAYGIIMIILLLPTLFISKVDPADTVRVK